MPDSEGWYEFAVGQRACPACHERVAVTVLATMTTDGDGRQYLNTEPDMTKLWSHTFEHVIGDNAP